MKADEMFKNLGYTKIGYASYLRTLPEGCMVISVAKFDCFKTYRFSTKSILRPLSNEEVLACAKLIKELDGHIAEWISVNDRMPKTRQNFDGVATNQVVAWDGNDVYTGWFYLEKTGFRFYGANNSKTPNYYGSPVITHWMEPPRKGWINADERKPKQEQLVLVYVGDSWEKVMIGKIRNDGWWEYQGIRAKYRVTHWMPLPDPPEVTGDV